jgi:hypothetical protein
MGSIGNPGNGRILAYLCVPSGESGAGDGAVVPFRVHGLYWSDRCESESDFCDCWRNMLVVAISLVKSRAEDFDLFK